MVTMPVDEFCLMMRKKFNSVVNEQGRSPVPWIDFNTKFLVCRFFDEFVEFLQSIEPISGDGISVIIEDLEEIVKELPDEFPYDEQELLDLGNFSKFLYLKQVE